VPDTARDGPHVHPSRNELGHKEMAQVMQPTVHPQAAGQRREAVGHAVGSDRLGAVSLAAEYIGVGRETDAAGERLLGLLEPAGAQQLHHGGPDGHTALLERVLVHSSSRSSPGRLVILPPLGLADLGWSDVCPA
jgi:hypothetical protein